MSFSKEDSMIYNKAFDFSVQVFKVYKYLCNQKHEYELAKQLLRSSTSIGANIREGLEGQSKKDFIAKLSISLKEAAETEYWLDFLVATGVIKKSRVSGLLSDLTEIIKILTSILNTARE